MFAFISCLILFLWLTIILGYTDPNIGLQGTQVQNRFFKIDGFGNKFAIFNVQAFGYLAYIYLPLLLFPLYRLYDNTEYSFRKIQLTFATLLLFMSLLILQSLIFGVGIIGNGICNMLIPYIGFVGVVILVLLLILITFFITWRRSLAFTQKYLGAKTDMILDSWKSSIAKMQMALAKFKLNYMKKKDKKTFSSEYSEKQTITNSKYAFKESLIENPLDEMTHLNSNHNEVNLNFHDIWHDNAKIPLVQNNIKAKVQESNKAQESNIQSTNISQTNPNTKNTKSSNQELGTKQTKDTKDIDSMNKILFNPKKNPNKTINIPYYNLSNMEQKVDILTKNHLPKTQDVDTRVDDVLNRFHKLHANKSSMPIDEQRNISSKSTKQTAQDSINIIKSFTKPVATNLDSKNFQHHPKTIQVSYNELADIHPIKKLEQNSDKINIKISPEKHSIEEFTKITNISYGEQTPSNQIKYSATKIQPKIDANMESNLETIQVKMHPNTPTHTKPDIIYSQTSQESKSIFTINEQNKTKPIRKPYIHTHNNTISSTISSEITKLDINHDTNQIANNNVNNYLADFSSQDPILNSKIDSNDSCQIHIESSSSPLEILAYPRNSQNEEQTNENSHSESLKSQTQEIIQSTNANQTQDNTQETKAINNSDLETQTSEYVKKKLHNIVSATDENDRDNTSVMQNINEDSNNYKTDKNNTLSNLAYTQNMSESNENLNTNEQNKSLKLQLTPIIAPQQGIQEIAKQFLPSQEINKISLSNPINQAISSIDFTSMNTNTNIAPIYIPKDSIVPTTTHKIEKSKEAKIDLTQITEQINPSANQHEEKYELQHHDSNNNPKVNNPKENYNKYKDIQKHDFAQNDYIDNNNNINIINSQNYDDSGHSNVKQNDIEHDNAQKYDNMKEYKSPPLSLLQPPTYQEEIQDIEIDSKIANLLNKLHVFKIRGDIVRVFTGPVVTTFEFRPEPDVKVNKVQSLQDDLAMALKAKSIRIQAPIPGKDVIGIEIPNGRTQTIYLRDVLESSAFLHSVHPLSITLGKDIMGNIVIENLSKLPHLLVAGTTGSGKSVGVNAIILSLLYRNSPDDLKLMMIDPKQVEFAPYEDLPHLITPIINAPDKAVQALYASTAEMDKRYKTLSDAKMKNIHSYNERYDSKMPFFVIVIDELADLIMTGGKDAEASITRIAQMGRAAGMHLIVATQRSSVDVVTGLIKTNLPSRISYRVGNKTDSKVILDEFGAERLLGNGDGLFKSVDSLKRIHAPWVSEQEIESIVHFIKQQMPVQYDTNFLGEQKHNSTSFTDKVSADAGLLEEARAVILRDNKASISNLQRRLSIGYNKAATLIEALQAEGFLSAPNTKGERSILNS